MASRKVAGVSELWLLDVEEPGEPQRIWRGDSDTVVGAFDISPDGQALVAAVKRPGQRLEPGKAGSGQQEVGRR